MYLHANIAPLEYACQALLEPCWNHLKISLLQENPNGFTPLMCLALHHIGGKRKDMLDPEQEPTHDLSLSLGGLPPPFHRLGCP